MAKTKPWWPEDLGEPSSSGRQSDAEYAVFPDAHRLLVRQNGETATYDMGSHAIIGVSQHQTGSGSLTFSSQAGAVDLADLKRV